MSSVTTFENGSPSAIEQKLLSPAEMAAALELFRLPDVSGLALPEDPTPQDLASLVDDLDERLDHARLVFNELTKAIREMRSVASEQVQRAIIAAGAQALPHDTLVVELIQRYERKRDVAALRTLEGAIPAAEYHEAVFIKAVDVKGCADIPAINALVQAGAKPVWEIDLRKLDKIGRAYGGKIATLIEDATARVALGEPSVKITRRERALRGVGGAA